MHPQTPGHVYVQSMKRHFQLIFESLLLLVASVLTTLLSQAEQFDFCIPSNCQINFLNDWLCWPHSRPLSPRWILLKPLAALQFVLASLRNCPPVLLAGSTNGTYSCRDSQEHYAIEDHATAHYPPNIP